MQIACHPWLNANKTRKQIAWIGGGCIVSKCFKMLSTMYIKTISYNKILNNTKMQHASAIGMTG